MSKPTTYVLYNRMIQKAFSRAAQRQRVTILLMDGQTTWVFKTHPN